MIMNDILKILNQNEVFNESELDELLSSIEETMTDYINTNIHNIMYENFEKSLINYTYQIYATQLLPAYNYNMKFIIEFKLINIIRNIKNELYISLLPRRSYPYSFIRNITHNIKHMEEKITILENEYQPVQRTEEWYIFRNNILTASSIWKVFGTQSCQNQLIYEKCCPYVEHKQTSPSSPLHWGQKYEPVSTKFYEYFYKAKIQEFGCIKHNKYNYIGASPDGIVINKTNPRYGRMLEIKNVVSRIITGIPKMEYWIQMQLQMETCDLNECDFLETKFIEYEGEEDFNNDGCFSYSNDRKLKGIIIAFAYEDRFHYEYANILISKDEYKKWEKEILEKNSHMIWMQNIYWKLQEYSNILVLRNKLWFANALPKITDFWETILHEKTNGFGHRAPSKRKRPNNSDANNVNNANINKDSNHIFNSQKCMIRLPDDNNDS